MLNDTANLVESNSKWCLPSIPCVPKIFRDREGPMKDHDIWDLRLQQEREHVKG